MTITVNCLSMTPESIERAHNCIKTHIRRTPLLNNDFIDHVASSPNPAALISNDVPLPSVPEGGKFTNEEIKTSVKAKIGIPKFRLHFKAENLQHIGAFKARGGLFALLQLIDELGIDQLRKHGVVTHSSGNHAQALAFSAARFNIPAYIVMPREAAKSKIAGAKRYATEIIFAADSTIEERERSMKAVQDRTNAIFVPPFDHPHIILGQGTVGLEISSQFQTMKLEAQQEEEKQNGAELDAVVVPLGGGGLLSGIATWFSDKTRTRVYGAEPSFEGADDGRQGRKQGERRIESVKSSTIADGLRVPVGINNWKIVSDPSMVQEIFSVSEEEIKQAMRLVFEHLKMVVEPSACVPLAVVLFNAEFRIMVAEMQAEEKKDCWELGIVLSGGNITIEKICEIFHS